MNLGGGAERCVQSFLVASPKGKSPLGRPRPRWEDNNKTDVQESYAYWTMHHLDI